MKLWMKLFAFVFLLFILTFYVGIFLISRFSYQAGLETARNQAFTEHSFITNSFAIDLSSLLERNRKDEAQSAIRSLMSYYGGYYKNQNVTLALLQNGEFIAGNLPDTKDTDKIKNPSNERFSIVTTSQSKKYLLVSGNMLNDYVFVYSRDITSLVDAQNQLTKRLSYSVIGITLFFTIVLYFVLKILTKPLRTLQSVTEQISAGNFQVRAKVTGNDEISTLSACFNEMAEEIRSKIEEHKKISLQKQQFIDNLSHELKTPLTSIYGYAEFLQKTKVSEEDFFDATSHIMQDVKRIQAMSKKLLDLAMARDAVIDFQPIPLPTLFERLQKELHVKLTAKNLALILHREADVMYGDTVLIENLLINLLDNAVKASHNHGKLFLSCYGGEDVVTVEIRDEGVGISSDHLESIFEPFYRTDPSRTKTEGVYDGTGLGLALCKQIVDAHHAKMDVSSKPDKGTKITITFTTPQQIDHNSINGLDYDIGNGSEA